MPSKTWEFRRNRDRLLAGRPDCVKCGKPMIFKGDLEIARWWLHSKAATANHRVPTIEGGSDALSNLEPMHRGCNSSLGNQQRRTPDNRRLRDFGSPRLTTYDHDA